MDVLNKLTADWKDVKEVIVYGLGRVAQRNIGKIIEDFKVPFIIDNAVCKERKSYRGIPVLAVDEVTSRIFDYKILVVTSTLAYDSIKKELVELGLEEYSDFCRWEEFLPEWYWKYRGEVCISQLFSTITSRCTLRCNYCSMLMPEYESQYTYTVDDIVKDFELLFQKIDYLTSWYVMGGEPLLHKDLGNIVESVYDRFHQKIGYMQIITNGTIVPDAELIRVIRKCNVNVRVSDYTHAVPYTNKYDEVIQCLQDNEIDYTVSCYKTWVNLGFPREDVCISENPEVLRQHMLNCAKGCHSMNDGKLFFCGLLYASEKLGLYNLKDTDYIDLNRSINDNTKEEVLRYFLGDVEGGYISLCRYCRGQGTDNRCVVPAAEQRKSKTGDLK